MNNQLTLHIVNTLPWSNLNRDDSGLPKRLRQGGVQRGLLSSQAIKRAARSDYENKSQDISVRSANLADEVAKRALAIAPDGDANFFKKEAKKRIGALTKKDNSGTAKDSTGTADESGRSAWLSSEEIDAAAQAIVSSNTEEKFIDGHRTGSLAIAAFGRMFANAPEYATESALSVSPAVSTHATVIESDYFSTVDDRPTDDQGAGATFLGVANYLNGVFYRTVTIDRAQLRRSWSAFDTEGAAERLHAFVTSVVYKLPSGKSHGTAPYTLPALVLVEEQAYRTAYDFETPVAAKDNGGYLEATIERLKDERESALRFDEANFGDLALVAGTVGNLDRFGLPVTDRQGVADAVTKWIFL